MSVEPTDSSTSYLTELEAEANLFMQTFFPQEVKPNSGTPNRSSLRPNAFGIIDYDEYINDSYLSKVLGSSAPSYVIGDMRAIIQFALKIIEPLATQYNER